MTNEQVFFDFLLFFLANERYKHINLLNIFISATLVSLESTLQFPFSLVFLFSYSPLRLKKRGGRFGLEVEESEMNKAEDVITTARHTKHTDVEKDVPPPRIQQSVIVELKTPSCGLSCPDAVSLTWSSLTVPSLCNAELKERDCPIHPSAKTVSVEIQSSC